MVGCPYHINLKPLLLIISAPLETDLLTATVEMFHLREIKLIPVLLPKVVEKNKKKRQ